ITTSSATTTTATATTTSTTAAPATTTKHSGAFTVQESPLFITLLLSSVLLVTKIIF
ncbi:unnamed protein product, partial [Adineta steineri]